MYKQVVKLMEKPWIRNLISFSVGAITFFLLGGIPLIIYSKRVDAALPMIYFGAFIAPLASGFFCGLSVHEKGRFITIVSFAVLLIAVGYIVLYATGSIDWTSPVFPAIGGGIAIIGSSVGSEFVKSMKERKQAK